MSLIFISGIAFRLPAFMAWKLLLLLPEVVNRDGGRRGRRLPETRGAHDLQGNGDTRDSGRGFLLRTGPRDGFRRRAPFAVQGRRQGRGPDPPIPRRGGPDAAARKG